MPVLLALTLVPLPLFAQNPGAVPVSSPGVTDSKPRAESDPPAPPTDTVSTVGATDAGPTASTHTSPAASATDSTPPVIFHTPCPVMPAGQPIQIRARFLDKSRLVNPRVAFRKQGTQQWTYEWLKWDLATTSFVAVLPPQLAPNFVYSIDVFDEHGNGPSRKGGLDNPIAVEITSSAPECNHLPPLEKRLKPIPVADLDIPYLFRGRVDVGGAMFVTQPQSTVFESVGGAVTGKAGIRLSRNPRGFLRRVLGEVEGGWYGFSQGLTGRSGGVGFGGAGIAVLLRNEWAWFVPRLDTHVGIARTGNLTRLMFDATAAADFDVGAMDLGPFVKYAHVASAPDGEVVEGAAHLVSVGLTVALGPKVELRSATSKPPDYSSNAILEFEEPETEWVMGDIAIPTDQTVPTRLEISGLTVDIMEEEPGSLTVDGLSIDLAEQEGLVLSGFSISLDPDQDGIPSPNDACPEEAEDLDGFEDQDGCPDPDNDGDGVLDSDDACPNTPGIGERDGCPKEEKVMLASDTDLPGEDDGEQGDSSENDVLLASSDELTEGGDSQPRGKKHKKHKKHKKRRGEKRGRGKTAASAGESPQEPGGYDDDEMDDVESDDELDDDDELDIDELGDVELRSGDTEPRGKKRKGRREKKRGRSKVGADAKKSSEGPDRYDDDEMDDVESDDDDEMRSDDTEPRGQKRKKRRGKKRGRSKVAASAKVTPEEAYEYDEHEDAARTKPSDAPSNRMTAEEAPPQMQKVVKAVEDKKLLFPYGKPRAMENQTRSIHALVQLLRTNPKIRIRIAGHADHYGTEEYNKLLSLWRARVIKRQLVAAGIAADRIEVEGQGESKPLAPRLDGWTKRARRARQLNRRVEFYVLDDSFELHEAEE